MIGLFDSGIGGLTVVREVMRKLPNQSLLYFGDTARTPYGNKSPEVIKQYGLEATRFLVERGAKVIVVACNTVSAVGLEAIKERYPEIEVIDVITPAVLAIKKISQIKRVGVMGTRALVNSGIYQKLLKIDNYKVTAWPAPLLVPLVEEGWLDKPETKRIVKHYLLPFKQAQVEVLVLACTHYPLVKKLITTRLSKRIKVIDPAQETAALVAALVNKQPALAVASTKPEHNFFVTDLTVHTQAIAQKWLQREVNLEKVNL
ncbi:MAG: glutamate racemase [Candidatus Kerfeldbacteria bacterium]|nr:glutamate racemase [Candidatus Kerfeldbacteria bacterium]